jgi:hypothetical protein
MSDNMPLTGQPHPSPGAGSTPSLPGHAPGPLPAWPAPAPRRTTGWSTPLIVGLVAAAAGFLEISFSSSRTVNGVVVDCSYLNLAPWLFGPAALVAGAVVLARAVRAEPVAGRDRALGALCVVVGLVHLLGAAGVVGTVAGSPC